MLGRFVAITAYMPRHRSDFGRGKNDPVFRRGIGDLHPHQSGMKGEIGQLIKDRVLCGGIVTNAAQIARLAGDNQKVAGLGHGGCAINGYVTGGVDALMFKCVLQKYVIQ